MFKCFRCFKSWPKLCNFCLSFVQIYSQNVAAPFEILALWGEVDGKITSRWPRGASEVLGLFSFSIGDDYIVQFNF